MASSTTQVGADAASAFPPFDPSSFSSQLVWLAITFGLFYLLMSKIALPRISAILETRSGRIASDLDEANRLKDESDAAMAAYEQELAEAKTRAHTIAQDARDSAKAEIDAKRAGVEAELATKVAAAEERISKIKSKAMGEVGTIAEDTTSALLEQILGAKVTKADIKSAVSMAKR